MGEAILKGLSRIVEKSTKLMVSEVNLERRDYIQTTYKIIVAPDNRYLFKYSDAVIMAVKPQDVDALLAGEICCDLSAKKLLISIAAGITTKHIESIVGKEVPVIRVMPNMPATIGQGISGIAAGTAARPADMDLAREIFAAVGETVEVREELMDAVTAISGSGPAYFFYLCELLIESAKALGLDAAMARRLVMKTALGSVNLIEASREDPAQARKRVASKGGTTEAAFKVFEAHRLAAIIAEATEAACKRSQELSKR